jgi:hypothetical protein
MLTEKPDPIASMHMQTTSEREQLPPPWFAQLALLTHWFHLRALLPCFAATLQIVRRVDATAALDVLLLMLAALIGNCPLAHAHAALTPLGHALPAVWGRKALTSRSAASRFLAALTAPMLDAMHTLFCPPSVSTASRVSAPAV